jgi:hypothetical protein
MQIREPILLVVIWRLIAANGAFGVRQTAKEKASSSS